MKLYPILSALAVCLGLASQSAQAVVTSCLPHLLPSNPDTAYTLPTADTATHAPTGLTWKRCSEGQSWDGGTCSGTPGNYTWAQALALGINSSFAGHSDWRLPNVKELRSLVEECRNSPAINNTIFPGTLLNYYWSSSPQEPVGFLLLRTWVVDFATGLAIGEYRSIQSRVRLVRGGDYFDKFNPSGTALLSISAKGTGSGTVSSDASDVSELRLGQVSCTSTASSLAGTCLITLPTNSSVTLTATPATDGIFSGWSGVCSGTSLTCSVNMNAAKAVTAAFSGGTAVLTAPATPTGLAATAGDASASIAFTPASGGGAATNFVTSCTATGATTLTNTGSGSPIAITGMTNGTSYSCAVLAHNSAGSSVPSAPVSVMPKASTAPPDALTSLVATAGDTSASIAFAAPTSGGAVTGYTASCTATGATTRTGTASSSPIAIIGMTNGTSYSCAVWATNSHGPGPSVSVPVTPAAPVAGTGCYPLSNPIESSLANAHSGSVTFTSGGSNAKGGPCYSPTVINNNPDWIHLVGQLTAVANSGWVINYSVTAYTGTTPRIGSLSIGTADVPADIRTYSITQYGPDGMPAPTCTLTASPASITTGGSSTLTASCDVAATSFVWSGGNCGNNVGASCTDTPTATTPYTVRGINSTGTGPVAPATVTVVPACTLTATPASITAGDSSTLTASCDQTITSYVWTGDSCAGTTAASCTVTPANTTSYSVAGVSSSNGTSAAATASVTVLMNYGAVAGTLITRYRLYNDVIKEHLYTTDLNEYTVLAAGGGWVAEGAIYKLFQGAGSLSGVAAVPYYRLSNPSSGLHHWTTDQNEYNVLGTLGWTQESIDGYILPTAVAGTLPLYRLYLNAFGGLHLWTTDANERNVLTTTAGWVDEGIAGYVIPLQ